VGKVTVYIRVEDEDAWAKVPNKSEFISEALRGELKLRSPTAKKPSPSKGLVKVAKEIQKVDKRNPDIDAVLAYWAQVTGLPINSKVPLNRANAKTLLNRRSLSQVKQLIDGAAIANMDKYSGLRISNIIELQMNESKLILWGRNKTNEPQKERSIKL